MSAVFSELILEIKKHLEFVANFPITGFNFPDITPIIEKEPALFREIIEQLIKRCASYNYDTVSCIESFGYVFGIPIAYSQGCHISLMRRGGKLPRRTITKEYSMCYDSNCSMELNVDTFRAGARVLIVDDFLASGGTASTAIELTRAAGGTVAGLAFVVEIPSLNGRAALAKYAVPIIALAEIEI
jgi:adenine phosphoribosyltransferase